MNTEKECEQIFDSLRKVLFYVGHGKYNDYMTLEEVQNLKAKLEKILDVEKEYEKATTIEEKEAIYKRISIYKEYAVKDFIDMEIQSV